MSDSNGKASREGPPAVWAEGLTKSYGDHLAVNGIDLRIPLGVTFGFLGPNGAGKSSAFRMIYAASPVTSGRLEVLGLDVKTRAREVKSRIGVTPQEDILDPELTVEQNLEVFGRYHRMDRARIESRIVELLDLVRLSDRRKDKIDTLSGGMKRRLTLVRALMADPELAVLDEPTTGLDPQARRFVWDLIDRLKADRKTTFLLSTHYMEEAQRLCDRLVVMHQGGILAEGTPAELIASEVGAQVVTFSEPDERKLEAWREIAAQGRQAERFGGELIVFLRADQPVQPLLESVPCANYGVRHANLEDVFLKLTGRALDA